MVSHIDEMAARDRDDNAAVSNSIVSVNVPCPVEFYNSCVLAAECTSRYTHQGQEAAGFSACPPPCVRIIDLVQLCLLRCAGNGQGRESGIEVQIG
jgi:hypothetical protein